MVQRVISNGIALSFIIISVHTSGLRFTWYWLYIYYSIIHSFIELLDIDNRPHPIPQKIIQFLTIWSVDLSLVSSSIHIDSFSCLSTIPLLVKILDHMRNNQLSPQISTSRFLTIPSDVMKSVESKLSMIAWVKAINNDQLSPRISILFLVSVTLATE